MSFHNLVANGSFTAGGDIRPARFVKITGNYTVSEADAGEAVIGISTNGARLFDGTLAASSGQSIGVFGEGQECFLTLGDTVTAGALLKSDADGRGVAATVENYGAIALDGGAVGGVVRVKVSIGRVDIDTTE